MTKPIRWGIIGTGMIAGIFAEGLGKASRSTKQAVGSRSQAKASAFAAKYGFPKAHGSYEALFADPEVDAVYISTPHTNHHAETLAALRAGKHVLVEKPMAVMVAEAEEMVAAAKKAGKVLLEAFMYRTHPQTRKIESLLKSGAIGVVRTVRSCFTFGLGDSPNIRLDPKLRGGALFDVGCYCINASRMAAGGEPDQIVSTSRVEPQTGVDVNLAASLRFRSGALAHFDVGIRSAYSGSLEILGSEGRIVVPNPWKPDAKRTSFTLEEKGKPAEEIVISDGGDIYALEADHLADVIGGAATTISGEQGIGNTKVLETIWRQIHG